MTPLSSETLAKMLRNEYGAMPEAFYNLYSITNNREHLQLAKMFYHNAVPDPLAKQQDLLNKLHANTVIPKITGEARGYKLTSDKKEKTITEFFWDTVIKDHTYAHGGDEILHRKEGIIITHRKEKMW